MLIVRDDDAITEIIIREAIIIHRDLGPGLLESAYETFLAFALQDCGLNVERQVPVPVRYRGHTVEVGYRIDLLVERQVVVEIKSIDKLATAHTQQGLTHIRLGGYPTGLILNFGAGMMRDGIRRLVNDRTYNGGSPGPLSGEPRSAFRGGGSKASLDSGPLKQIRRVLQSWALFIADRIAPT